MRSLTFTFTFVSLALLFVACSSEETSTSHPSTSGDDAGTDSSNTGRDTGTNADGDPEDAGVDADEPLTAQAEKEPNNGASATDFQDMKIPGTMTGAIDPANDADVFAVTPAAGEFWEWKITPKGADLAPHVTVFDNAPNNLNPTVLAKGAAGDTVTIQHFVLGAGKFLAAVRDARNVPTGIGKGGATYGYTFSAKKIAPQPTAMNVGDKKTGTLASLSSTALFSFTLAQSTGLDVIVRADRKTAPSTLDSRLSIFDVGKKKSIGTNDDATSTTDSELGGTLPAGSYVIVLENEGTDATDLSYEVEIVAR